MPEPAHAYRPRTVWNAQGRAVRPGEAPGATRQADAQAAAALLRLLADSLAAGHHRVALRRWSMMVACGYAVPATLQAAIDELLARCPPRQVDRMQRDAEAWARFIGRHRMDAASLRPPAASPRACR